MTRHDAKVANQGVGTPGFVRRHGLHTEQQLEAVQKLTTEIREKDLRTVRMVIVDQHGIPRAKFLSRARRSRHWEGTRCSDERSSDYYLTMKPAEWALYREAVGERPPPEGSVVSEWEMREYFEVY